MTVRQAVSLGAKTEASGHLTDVDHGIDEWRVTVDSSMSI